jgi:hypothetical protein
MVEPTRFQQMLASDAWKLNEGTSQLSRNRDIRLHYQRARELCRASGGHFQTDLL